MQQQQNAALAKLQQARTLLDTVEGLIASAVLTLEEDGGYSEHEGSDTLAAVRDEIAELELLVKEYVN